MNNAPFSILVLFSTCINRLFRFLWCLHQLLCTNINFCFLLLLMFLAYISCVFVVYVFSFFSCCSIPTFSPFPYHRQMDVLQHCILRQDNCFFIVVQPLPLGQIVRGEKFHEKRSTDVHRKNLLLCSPMTENPTPLYGSDKAILPSRIYAVAFVASTTAHEGARKTWIWTLDPILILRKPVYIGVPVGQKQQAPRPEHHKALHDVNEAIFLGEYDVPRNNLLVQSTLHFYI